MIYKYDEAIVHDLKKSFNDSVTCISAVGSDGIIDIAAQIHDDKIKFPLIALQRPDNIDIDNSRTNFTHMHAGQITSIDAKSNFVASSAAIPINLTYTLSVLSYNVEDVDEIIRELLFKYINMYFLEINIDYDIQQSIRFGVSVSSTTIERSSGTYDFLSEGKLNQASISLACEGCVLLQAKKKKLEVFQPRFDIS